MSIRDIIDVLISVKAKHDRERRYSKLKEKLDYLWLYAVLNLTAQ